MQGHRGVPRHDPGDTAKGAREYRSAVLQNGASGFSQGAALSLFTGLQLESVEKKLAGIAILSGYLAAAKSVRLTPGLESTPILHCHGTADPMVVHAMAEKSREALLGMGVTNYELKSYKGLVHSVNMEEVADVMAFLTRVLPPDKSTGFSLRIHQR